MKLSCKIFLTFILLLGAQFPLHAQMQWSVDTTHIRLGEQILLSVQNAPSYPSIDDLTQNDIIAIEQWYDTAAAIQRTRMTSFEVGEHWLKLGDDSLLITVDDVANVDTSSTDIKDIVNIEKEPLTAYDILRWVWIPIVIALLIWILLWWRRKHTNKNSDEEPHPSKPPLPADQQALQDLEQLRIKQLWQHGKTKEYHTELTDIVRLYLERAHNIPSSEMTSGQTMEAYRNVDIAVDMNRDRLQRILQTADMVKFAKSEPLPYEHDRSLNDAIDFIKEDWKATTISTAAANTSASTVKSSSSSINSEKEAPHA